MRKSTLPNLENNPKVDKEIANDRGSKGSERLVNTRGFGYENVKNPGESIGGVFDGPVGILRSAFIVDRGAKRKLGTRGTDTNQDKVQDNVNIEGGSGDLPEPMIGSWNTRELDLGRRTPGMVSKKNPEIGLHPPRVAPNVPDSTSPNKPRGPASNISL
jgi:hypothetical protein